MDPRRIVLGLIYGRWRRGCPFEDGYVILLPSPEDMPFLLQFALEGLRRIDTTNCRQILVIGDGCGADRGAALRRVVEGCDDPRIELVLPGAVDRFVQHRIGIANGSANHWMTIVNGTTRARTAHAFLHDSDAFFLEADGLERQYRACRDGGFDTLGVTARLDPRFLAEGLTIPATWELMFSTRWARSRSPFHLKGRRVSLPGGELAFDTMLASQYADYGSGRIGVLDPPPRLVHFSGTIVTYRIYRDRAGERVIDELFRLLLLAMLEDLVPAPDGTRVTPRVAELARGLDDPAAPVGYDSPVAVQQYPIFRAQLEDLCNSPIFAGEREARIREQVRPFDDHFAGLVADPLVENHVGVRASGLG